MKVRDRDKYKYDLSIIIVSYNTCSLIVKCIESIYKFAENLLIQIIVSDNASSDDTVETIEKKFPEVFILQNGRNIGFGAANNRAINYCKGRFVLFLNPDIILLEPSFKRMLEFLDKTPDAGIVGCKLINPDGSIQKSFHKFFPTLINRFLESIYFEKLMDKCSSYQTKTDDIMNVAAIVGACMLLKEELLRKVGGFDELFFMYCEDIDVCYRVRQMGYDIYYLGNIVMLHYLGASAKKNRQSYFTKVLTKESVYQFFKKHHGKVKAILYRILMIIGATTRLLILLPLVFFRKILPIAPGINYYHSILKYTKVISWGLGFEKWTKNPG